MQETESSNGFLSKDLSDSANKKNEFDDIPDSDFKLKDILLTGNIKIMFIGGIVVGIIFSVYYGAITALLAFCFAGVFMLDLMGILDSFKSSKRKMSHPDGYENIE